MRLNPLPFEKRLDLLKDQYGTSQCWPWPGKTAWTGYVVLTRGGRPHLAHRVAYELLVGPIPEGKQLDHLCRVRHCINPNHLEPVLPRTNVLRGQTVAAANSQKTHCQRGHPLSGVNLRIRGINKRACRACSRMMRRAHRLRHINEARAYEREAHKRQRSKK